MLSQPSDLEITANIKQKLMDDTSLSAGAKRISVTTEHGVVTLKGSVATKHESYRVVSLVEEVPGVIRVRNQLFISHSLE